MFSFLGWMVVGLVAGLLARAMVPGRQPMGIMMTMVLGIVGSLIGGFVSSLLFGQDPAAPGFHPAGFIGSTIGAVLALMVYLRSTARMT